MALRRYANRHPGLLATLYVLFIPAAIAAVVGLGTIDHYRSEGRIAKLAREGKQAHDAICLLRADLHQRIARDSRRLAQTRQLLKKHPHIFAGIPKALIEKSLADDAIALHNEQQTAKTLAVNHC